MMKLTQIRGHHFWPAPLNKESVVIDAGAHRGEFSAEIIKRYGCRCFLVEADPILASEIKVPGVNATISGALAAHDGTRTFYLHDNPEGGTLHEERSPTRSRGLVGVETISLQSLMRRIDAAKVDLLKLDVEGAEFDLIASTPPAVLSSVAQITAEFHDFEAHFGGRGLFEKARARLEALGFVCAVMSFRTHGDVVFLNQKSHLLSVPQSAYLRHFARFVEKMKAISFRR